MIKKILALLLAALLMMTVMAGCTRVEEVWISGKGNPNTTVGNSSGEGKTTEKRTRVTTAAATTKAQSGVITRTRPQAENMVKFTPVDDSGANYKTKGTVSIAVDTTRPSDFTAMFDVMMSLYPDITFNIDYYTSDGSGAAQYLTTHMATGTAANIIWDEAGHFPKYLAQGWVYPITSFVNKDPEAKNLPANFKKDYTFCGELYALPHQATFTSVSFNMNLLQQAGMKLPGLEWSMEEYEKYLVAGSNLYSQKKGVAIEDLFEIGASLSFYNMLVSGKAGSENAYNYDTRKIEPTFLYNAYKQAREWRVMRPGVEAWHEQQQRDSKDQSALNANIGVSEYTAAWEAGKALLENSNSTVTESWDALTFQWKQWPFPNKDGKLILHVDHCFITSTTPTKDIDACFQALRFMTYATNGNLARLAMYEDSQKNKYNLNCHVYYPVTTSKAVVDKFNALPCTDATDEYFLKNIANSARYDNWKMVPEIYDLSKQYIQPAYNDVTDGLDPDGSGITEAVDKFNKAMATAWSQFEKSLKEAQNEFNKTHK